MIISKSFRSVFLDSMITHSNTSNKNAMLVMKGIMPTYAEFSAVSDVWTTYSSHPDLLLIDVIDGNGTNYPAESVLSNDGFDVIYEEIMGGADRDKVFPVASGVASWFVFMVHSTVDPTKTLSLVGDVGIAGDRKAMTLIDLNIDIADEYSFNDVQFRMYSTTFGAL